VFFAVAVFATPPHPAWFVRSWQTEDGLPEHNIVGIEQTPDGFLRIATYQGLVRFDGVRFQEVPGMVAEGPGGGQFRAMVRSEAGDLCLARDGGTVTVLRNGARRELAGLGPLGFRGQPRAMVADPGGSVWVADSGGSVFRTDDRGAQVFGASAGLRQGWCRLAADRLGRVWVSQAGEVGCLREGKFERQFSFARQMVPIARAAEGGLWAWSGLGLYRCREGAGPELAAKLAAKVTRASLEVSTLFEDRKGGVWIGASAGGLFRFDGRSIEEIDPSLPSITAIFEDSEDDVWVGARGGGLNRFRPRVAEVIGVAAGLPFAAVQSVSEDAAGTLWVAGQEGGLARLDGQSWRLLGPAEGWDGGATMCLAADSAGGLFVGTREQGVFRHEAGRFAPAPFNSRLASRFIRSLLVTSNGDLWIGPSTGSALHRWRQGDLQTVALPAGAGNVRTLAEGGGAQIWAGTSNGLLLRFTGEALVDETVPVMGGNVRGIRCLQATKDGSLWFGLAGQGLGRLTPAGFRTFHSGDGLWDEYISQIVADDNDRLWLAGNRGMCLVSRSELEEFAAGRVARFHSVILGRGEGLPNLQASFGVWPTSGRRRDGRILMPMQTGLVQVQPALLRRKSRPPPVVVELIRANGQPFARYDDPGPPPGTNPPGGRLELGPGVTQLEFEYTALSLASPENVTFRYRLEGVDRDWVEVGAARVARYPRLGPGSYRFFVTARGRDGEWNETGASPAFLVRPFVWEIGWVRTLALVVLVAGFGGAVLFGARLRYQREIVALEQKQALERERARIAQDLHDDLGAGLVEINLGSELAQDEHLGVAEVREHVHEIGARARGMVTALDEIVWAVNPKHDTVSSLASYFCQYAQHFLGATAIRSHLEVARHLPEAPLNAEQRHSLFLAFKEALSNVARHSGATEIRLAIGCADQTLTVTVADNGRGLPAQAGKACRGDGIGNMRERLAQLGGRCELSAGAGGGTTVVFSVPLPSREPPPRQPAYPN